MKDLDVMKVHIAGLSRLCEQQTHLIYDLLMAKVATDIQLKQLQAKVSTLESDSKPRFRLGDLIREVKVNAFRFNKDKTSL